MSNRPISGPGMGALATAAHFYGEADPSDYDYQLAVKKRNGLKWRRKRGQKPVVVSPHRAHNPPCAGCPFEAKCKAQALACNHFAEWAVSKRPIVAGIKRLLPSKKWMALLAEAEDVTAVRKVYYAIIEKQTQQEILS